MPHSPYTQTVHPPIADLDSYKTNIGGYKARFEDGDTDKYDAGCLLEIAEDLMEHCEFLDGKIRSKVSRLILKK